MPSNEKFHEFYATLWSLYGPLKYTFIGKNNLKSKLRCFYVFQKLLKKTSVLNSAVKICILTHPAPSLYSKIFSELLLSPAKGQLISK